MKCKVLVVIMLCAGCMPASQQEVVELTGLVREIIPVVREIGGENNEKVERLLTDVERVNEAVATAEDPIEVVEEGWKASEAWNPYYGYGVLGISLWKLLQKKKESDNALEEVVIGVEDSKKNGGNLKLAFNATESLITRRKVAKILSNT
ncbi:hypothetical protein LCGC14_0622000 [marine sediment metagenome]|uniref:Uncharacterized protein n=1 Tax=marine sediment metagenome TaxID=412755 RepID=A0A0F9UD19_9ZZZZ|nr:hypothetical protein [Pricia sp.]